MNPSTGSNNELHITLEIESEDTYELDLTVTNAVSRDLILALQNDGYLIQLPETASTTRGGNLVIEIMQEVSNVATNIWMHKGVVERVLNDSSTLVTIFGGIIPIIQRIFQVHTKRVAPTNDPIKITAFINGNPVSVEAKDIETADAAFQLTQKYMTIHPNAAAQITLQSKTSIKGTIPKQQRHRGKGKR